MSKDLITRTLTRLYEERHMANENGRPIQDLLFSNMDEDLSAAFRLDRYISSPYGISYRNPTNQAIIRQFNPGTTALIEVPRASEKTPFDEELRDAVAVGSEPTDSQAAQITKNLNQTLMDHEEAYNMTKAKQALDVVRTGIFNAKGAKGASLGLDYDHTRDTNNNLTYDFTAGGATMNEALVNISNYHDSKGTPKDNRYVIMGDSWLSQYGSDSGIIEIMKANAVNQILEQQRFAEKFGEVNGLYVVAHYKPVGALAPLWILGYEPGVSYVPYKGASAEAWVPTAECLSGSLNDRTWNIKRGVDYLDDNGRVQRGVGEMIVDSYSEKDPITTFVRSQSRHIYIYGNIDHTLKVTGTF
jgi:hypothetical protein